MTTALDVASVVRDAGRHLKKRRLAHELGEWTRMTEDSYHRPVLVNEVVDLCRELPAGVVVDATLGGGGHATAILTAVPHLRILGIDRDPEARAAAALRLSDFGDRVRIASASFADMPTAVETNRDFIGEAAIVGVLMDLGVSSHQLDDPSRGFSFRFDAPLDMRMDPTAGETAAELLARISQDEFVRLLRVNGEGRFANAIASSVRNGRPTTTGELVALVERAVPIPARRRGNVATRVFQALRIAVNDEDRQLDEGLGAAFGLLAGGGALIVIAYHSGEDRAVKSFLHELSTGGCHCPPELGCVCGAIPTARILRASAVLASSDEIASNPRARSARLRVGWKLAE